MSNIVTEQKPWGEKVECPSEVRERYAEVARYFEEQVGKALVSNDLQGALEAYAKLSIITTNCNAPALQPVALNLLQRILNTTGASQPDVLKAIGEELQKLNNPGALAGVINEVTNYLRTRAYYTLGLDAIVDSIITVIDENGYYKLLMQVKDPVTGVVRAIEVAIKKREVSKVLELGNDYDVGKGEAKVVDPNQLIPKILKPHLADFTSVHYLPRGFTSAEFVDALLNRVMPTKMVSTNKMDITRVLVTTWLVNTVGVSVEVTRDKEGNVTRRDAEVRSVRAEQAIYIDCSEDMLLAPPQAYLHTVKSVNRKTQVTQLLRINGVLVSTKGHYIVHVNGSIRLEWFHVLGLKRLEEFYIPLINLFGHGGLIRDPEKHRKVKEIIVSRRYLCGRRVAEILPQHFTAMMGDSEFYFYFTSEREMERWESIADIIWSEYTEVLREYYDIIGVKHYVLPEKPKWMFNVRKA